MVNRYHDTNDVTNGVTNGVTGTIAISVCLFVCKQTRETSCTICRVSLRGPSDTAQSKMERSF